MAHKTFHSLIFTIVIITVLLVEVHLFVSKNTIASKNRYLCM